MKKSIAILTVICLAALLLAGCGRAGETEANKYIVLVMDMENAPIPGVTVEFCTDELCNVLTTDDTGVAELESAPAAYAIHLLKVPEGFLLPEEEYTLPAAGGLVTVNLRH